MARRRLRLPDCLSEDELARLLAAAEADGPRSLALVLLMAYGGLRVSEACRLRWDDIEGANAYVRMGKGRKDRVVPLHPRVLEALSALRKSHLLRSPYLFPSPKDPKRPITTRTAQYLVEDLCRRAGIPRRKAHPHALRHTAATRLLRATGNLELVRRFLGHASVSTTQVYTHLVTDDVARGIMQLP